MVSNGDFLSISMTDDLINAGVVDFAITIHDRDGVIEIELLDKKMHALTH